MRKKADFPIAECELRIEGLSFNPQSAIRIPQSKGVQGIMP
jgi:hypothetical protein